MGNNDLVPLIVGMLGTGGLGLFAKDIFTGIRKLRSGVSARETKRRIDIVQQRDEALTRESRERDRADAADVRARNAVELVARLRLQLIQLGVEPLENDAWIAIQNTVNRTKEGTL